MIYKKAQIISNSKINMSKARVASLRDYISEDDEPDGKYRILRRIKTRYQRIAVVKLASGKVWVYGDGYVMFGTTEDDNMWAESMVHIPMAVAKQKQNILMIGGGGGITTREVLRYRDVKAITVVDIDSTMMELGKNLKPLVKFNKGSLRNPKVRTVVQDGRAFVEKNQKKWDVIIIDVPEPSYKSLALGRLYSKEFYSLLKKRLAPGGAITIACSLMSEMPEFVWSIMATLKAAGFYVLPYHFDVMKRYGEDWGFCVAATRPISSLKISLSTRYLTSARLKRMFHIPSKYLRKWGKRKIQTDSNRVLASIHERH
ncbi:spermidine synthase [Paenibacillus sp. V4I3]|uniref:spermine/spermidine synthase domain-containing protein n=1 Tax=unclassified Paenibacillus TaxID=185978 RepID=UPI0027882A63|nr:MULTISPECIES: spermidine synthase [unclassified Paenibacillus]MDQ0873182.1 spermidine synthase [Paenibacillus sp. V4I3]MDQ0890902.1 spermidine synthase [Paenibacillus sp. V4I9]